MEKLIGDLDSMTMDLKNWQEQLRNQELPSQSIRLTANDMITWLGMAASVAETLVHVLGALEDAKAEVKEIIEEEKGGEVPSEQVSEPEDREASGEIPPQESGEQEPPGD